MKKTGLAPDRVAYNALFSALRVAQRPSIASDLWDEMSGRGEKSTSAKAAALADDRATPDIITLTDVIATLKDNHTRIDEIFSEAVVRGIVLAQTKVSLDSLWEVDVSSLSFPVARAACRYVLRRAVDAVNEGEEAEDLNIITGVATRTPEKSKTGSQSKSKTSNKREFLQQVLRDEFDPPVQSSSPRFAQGTIQIEKLALLEWIKQQNTS